jgi:hypothetical protein
MNRRNGASTSSGNRDAVESAIENAKRDKNSTWDEIAERPSRIPSWEDAAKGSKKVALQTRLERLTSLKVDTSVRGTDKQREEHQLKTLEDWRGPVKEKVHK